MVHGFFRMYKFEKVDNLQVLERLLSILWVDCWINFVLVWVKIPFNLSITKISWPTLIQVHLIINCFQIVISLEWLGLVPGCDYTPSDHILSLLYIIFLVILLSFLSIKYKNIRDNYNEAYSIFLLMLITVPIWICWISSALLLPSVYAKVAFGKWSIEGN